jgi:signal recognition particle subunit SRP54
VTTAENFDARIGITGVILTRMDGDGRGGAALSMRAVTGKPIRFVGLGEKMDALETFEPGRIAGRILGMGDIVALVERAQETLEAEQAERMMKRFQKGQFNMNDLKGQLEQMMKMGGMQGMMSMMPGMAKMQKQLDDAGFDDKVIKRQIALINSMTKKERANPDLMQASRKKRVAAGAGQDVSDLNKLLKMHRQMADAMKKLGKMGKKGLLRGGLGALMGKGAPDALKGMDPASMDPKAMEEAARRWAWAAYRVWAAARSRRGCRASGKRSDHAAAHAHHRAPDAAPDAPRRFPRLCRADGKPARRLHGRTLRYRRRVGPVLP